MPSRTRPLAGLCAAALAVLAAAPARADCAAVLAAYEKADATGRYAWYEVTDPEQAPSGDPLMISIGDATYVPVRGFKGKFQQTHSLSGVLAATLRRHESGGQGHCTPLDAARTLRGEPAIGFNVNGGVPISHADPASEDVWISRTTGLPIISGMDPTGHGGVIWVYGPAVTAPPPAKLIQ